MSAPANFVLPSTVAPTTWLPPRAGLFGERAARLRHLAATHPMGDWLRAVAQLCDAQQRLDGTLGAVSVQSIKPNAFGFTALIGQKDLPLADGLETAPAKTAG